MSGGASLGAQQFDVGEPYSGTELSQALGTLLARGHAFLAPWSDLSFFAPQGSAWSPAEHVRHLRKASSPLVTALAIPRPFLSLRWGTRSGPSRTFAQVREAYRGTLAAGGQAGRFAPSPEQPHHRPADRRLEIMSQWSSVTVNLSNQLERWPEAALDRYQLPHPLMGTLSVREMLEFTVYHTAHHFRRIWERRNEE